MSEQKEITPEQVLTQWEKAKTEAAKWKDIENQLRVHYVEMVSNPNKLEGTENIELQNGYKAKIVKKQNRNVDQEKVNDALDQIENTGEAGKLIAERLIKWKADLSKTEYDLLSDAHRKIIDTVITVTPGTPTLEIVAPKSKRQL